MFPQRPATQLVSSHHPLCDLSCFLLVRVARLCRRPFEWLLHDIIKTRNPRGSFLTMRCQFMPGSRETCNRQRWKKCEVSGYKTMLNYNNKEVELDACNLNLCTCDKGFQMSNTRRKGSSKRRCNVENKLQKIEIRKSHKRQTILYLSDTTVIFIYRSFTILMAMSTCLPFSERISMSDWKSIHRYRNRSGFM